MGLSFIELGAVKQCSICGKDFSASTRNQKKCISCQMNKIAKRSDKFVKPKEKPRAERKCDSCGRMFLATSNRKVCSRGCAWDLINKKQRG